MPECAFHKGVETNVTCTECGRYICPKDMVDTPVGYKCRECGLARPTRGGVKPRQLAGAAGIGLAAAVALGLVHAFIPFGGIILNAIYGLIIGEATRRGGGGHRGWQFATIAAGVAVLGAAVGLAIGQSDLFALVIWPIAAVFALTSLRLFA